MELLTEQSAVQTMHDSMKGIMELGFASKPACCTAHDAANALPIAYSVNCAALPGHQSHP